MPTFMTAKYGIITVLAFFTSCSFNKQFLQPTKVPAGAKKVTLTSKTDTMLVLFSPDTHQPVFLRNGRDTLDQGFSIESVVYKSASGNMLNGWFLKPKNQKADITILHLHGNGGFLLNQYQGVSSLIPYGFQVFVFDYSGYGFSEGKATRNNILADALSSLDYLRGREDVKGTRLVLYGQSLGGHLSAVAGSQRQDGIDALVIEGAFSSHKDIGAYTVPVLGRLLVKQGYCGYCAIKDFHKPLLVIHSTEDETIPFYMGLKIFAAGNQPKKFFEIKKCHICGPDFYPEDISRKIKAMLSLSNN